MKLLVQARQRVTGVARFIGQREFVVERLVILGGGHQVASGFISASTLQEQAWLRGSGGISGERVETKLQGASRQPVTGRVALAPVVGPHDDAVALGIELARILHRLGRRQQVDRDLQVAKLILL